MSAQLVGTPVSRIDGRKKVMGAAQYAAEIVLGNMTYAAMVSSSIAAGKVRSVDLSAALQAPGVLLALNHESGVRFGKMPDDMMAGGAVAEKRIPLSDSKILHAGQYLAMIVAESLEKAQYAASLVKVDYEPGPFAVDLNQAADTKFKPEQFMGEPLTVERGNLTQGREAAHVTLKNTYSTPIEHPCPLEPHAAVASWSGDTLTVYNSSQWVYGDRVVLCGAFGLPPEKVKVISPFIGGMFGSKGATGAHVLLAAWAARQLGRPVKSVLTRPQVLTDVGHRSQTVQTIEIGAKRDGSVVAFQHDVLTHTSIADDFPEPASISSRLLYDFPNYRTTHEMVRLNVMKPSWMRAPGEAPGQFALESALDELAWELKMDPVELRRRNHAERHPQLDKPFSSKHLLECYQRGAERFGWSCRKPNPGSMQDGKTSIGWGMATATYPGYLMGAVVKTRLEMENAEVYAVVSTAGADVGTGMYTMLAMTTADELGLPLDRVRVELGHSDLTPCAVAGGSNLTASTSPAAKDASLVIKRELLRIASQTADGFTGAEGKVEEFLFAEGRLAHRSAPNSGIPYADLLNLGRKTYIEGLGNTQPIFGHNDEYAFQSFGAHFVEVGVNNRLGTVRVSRVVSVFDCGKILNPKTTRSQFMGGIVFGIGAALLEELVFDPEHGQATNADLAGYLVPVNADVPEIDIDWIGEPDYHFNSMGVRGVGEIGITGVAAAVANAVFHATGKRVRDLPITPDKLI